MMNKATLLLIAGVLLVSTVAGLAEGSNADIDGAKVGKWTMDIDAAKKLAAEKSLPILLDFSGSDWCGWCKIMEESVFTKPEWAVYATNNLIMVLLDFPSDKSLVPEKYVARNEKLQAKFNVEGFPTFVVLDDDGETELGRLQAGQGKTPASFRSELEVLLRNRVAVKAEYAASLSPEARAEFDALNARITRKKAEAKEAAEEMTATAKRIEVISNEIDQLKEELRDFRVSQLDEERQQEYKKLKAAFELKENEFKAWIETQPERTEENGRKFQTMQRTMQSLAGKLGEF